MRTLLLIIMMHFASAAAAHPCEKKSEAGYLARAREAVRQNNCRSHRARPCAPAPAKPCTVVVVREVEKPAAAVKSYPFVEEMVSSFAIRGGFRWETELTCPTCPPCGQTRRPPHHDVKDPAFIGFSVRPRLTDWCTGFATWDRDWVEAPRWEATLGVEARPWRRHRE